MNTLNINGRILKPFKIDDNDPELTSYYFKYDEIIINVNESLTKSNNKYSYIVYKNEVAFKKKQIDGKNAMCTNFLLSYDDVISEILTIISSGFKNYNPFDCSINGLKIKL